MFLLVCSTVAAIVLASASVNADRSKRETSEQQGYYAVSSALNEAKSMWTTEDPMKSLVVTVSGSTVSATPSSYTGNAIANWAVQQVGSYVTTGTTTALSNVIVHAEKITDAPYVNLTYTMTPKITTNADGSTNHNYLITVTGFVCNENGKALEDGYTYDLSIAVVSTSSSATSSSSYTVKWSVQS